MAYNKLIDLNLLSNFLNKIKSLIPTKTSDLENDSEYITGMEILSYGNSTWNDFLTAYTAKKVVYCRASSNSNPASGSQTRLAFMAYVNNADNPTNVEFQYYRSVSSHTSTQQGDQVFVYKLDKTSGWSVITREASSKVVAGTNMTSSYSNDTVTLNASIPSNVSDLTNDSGYITGITSSDVTTALGYTPSSTDTTYSAGNGIDITNTIIKNTQGIEYIVGTQTAATAVWTGNSTDEALYIGKIIAYYLPYAGTSTAATLTLTMKNGATTEAIRLLRVGSNTITTQFAANNVIILIYDGTYWRVSAYYDSDTNTVPTGYCATGASTVAKSATCTYGYRDDTNYFPCLFRYANTAANATLAIASYGTTALPIYVNGERTSATNTFGRGVILFLYYDGAYYCYNDGRLPILVDGVVTSVQDYTNELKNTINKVSQVTTSTNIGPTSIATFEASVENIPLKGLTVNIEPVQAGSGDPSPTNVRGIFGWTKCNIANSSKNIFDIDNAIWIHRKLIAADGTIPTNSSYKYCANFTPIIGGRKITVSGIRTSGAAAFGTPISFYDDQKTFLSRISTFPTTGGGGYVQVTVDVPEDAAYFRLNCYDVSTPVSDFQIEYGDTATEYQPFASSVISWEDSAGTVYGGTLDVVNKKLTVDKIKIIVNDDSKATNGSIGFTAGENANRVGFPIKTTIMPISMASSGTIISDGELCNIGTISTLPGSAESFEENSWQLYRGSSYWFFRFCVSSNITTAEDAYTFLQNSGAEFTAPLATPIVYDLTANEITTFLGTNNIWANTGDITVTYGAYLEIVKAYIDQSITDQDLINNTQDERIEDLEQTTTAIAINPSAIATFEASAANMPLKSLTVNIEPAQDFNGYDSPWPGGSRKNLLNIDDLITAPSGTFGGYTFKHKLTLIVSPNTQYTLSTSYNDTGNVLYFNGTSGSGNCVKADAPKTFQSSETGELTILLYDRDGISSFENKTVTVQLEEGSTATVYEPYSNICPISGWTECKIFYPNLDITRDLAIVKNKYISTSGVETDSTTTDNSHTDYFPVTPGETLYFSAYWDEIPDTAPAITFYDADKNFVSPRKSFVTANNSKGVVGYNFATLTVPNNCYYAILNFSYSIRNRIVLTDKDPTITFPSTLGTVYGGTFDVANKKLIIDKGIVDLGDLTWGKTTVNNKYYYRTNIDNMAQMASRTMPVMSTQFITISDGRDFEDCPDQSIYNLDVAGANVAIIDLIHTSPTDFKTAVTGAMLVYPLASPIEIPITSTPDITTIFGENNIWADCGDVTVIYGEYLTQIKNNINDLDKCVKIIEDNDPLFDKLIHLPDDDSFFDKQGITTLGTYTKINKHTFKISGGSGTAYYSYPLHGTNKVIWGTNTQMLTRLTPSDFAPIPASGSWGNTTYSVGMRVYSETNTTNSNRNLEIDLWAANIQNDEFIGEPIVVASCIPTNYTKYCTTILKLRGTGFGPLSQYTHYAIFARSRSRASSAEAIIRLETVQSPRLMQYILYPTSAIETSLTATTSHAPNTFILNNDRLYKVLTQIQTGEEIVVGTNVTQVSILEALTSLLNNTENIPNTSSISNTGLISIKHDSTELFTIQLPLYNGGVSNGT